MSWSLSGIPERDIFTAISLRIFGGLDGTKQGTSKIYAKHFLQSRLNMGFLVSAVAHHCCSGVTLGKPLKTLNIK